MIVRKKLRFALTSFFLAKTEQNMVRVPYFCLVQKREIYLSRIIAVSFGGRLVFGTFLSNMKFHFSYKKSIFRRSKQILGCGVCVGSLNYNDSGVINDHVVKRNKIVRRVGVVRGFERLRQRHRNHGSDHEQSGEGKG